MALTIKMLAAKRGLKLEEHGSLWAFVNVLSIKSGDKDIIRFFNTANALHKNFYENEIPKMLYKSMGNNYRSALR